MPCYNCTSRVLRIFLQDSISASTPRLQPRLQHYYFRQQQQRFGPRTGVPFHTSRKLQSTLASGSATPLPSDDDYIPFGPPITTTNEGILASDDGGLSRLLPPPPPPAPISTLLQASYGYEPEVEILKLPEARSDSRAREAESKRTIELIRWKIEASLARKKAVYRSMVETGLPVVGGGADLAEDARLAVLEERAAILVERGSGNGVSEGSCEVKGKDKWKLPTMKQEAGRQARREAKKRMKEWKQAREIEGLSPTGVERELTKMEKKMERMEKKIQERVEKKMERKMNGEWGSLKAAQWHPIERRMEFKGGRFLEAKEDKDESLEVKEREDRGEVEVQRTIAVGRCQIEVPVVKQSLPKPTKARAPSIQEFIRDEGNPFDRKAFSRERVETRKSAGKKEEASQWQRCTLHDEAEKDFEQEQKRGKRKWKLPPIEEAERESKTGQWNTWQKLQHHVATTPKSELEAWKVQKAALQKKFGKGWAPRKVLSPKARDWVKELHSSAPELTTQKLAEIFKISPECIRRILKSNWTPSPREAQEREQRWLNRRSRIWERWIDIGRVQTKGMKAEFQKLKAEDKQKWLDEKDEAFEQYLEKMGETRKERRAVLDSMKGLWEPSEELFQDEPEFSDAGEMMRYSRNLQKKMEKERAYREGLRKPKSSEASMIPRAKFPAERLAKLSSRFL